MPSWAPRSLPAPRVGCKTIGQSPATGALQSPPDTGCSETSLLITCAPRNPSGLVAKKEGTLGRPVQMLNAQICVHSRLTRPDGRRVLKISISLKAHLRGSDSVTGWSLGFTLFNKPPWAGGTRGRGTTRQRLCPKPLVPSPKRGLSAALPDGHPLPDLGCPGRPWQQGTLDGPIQTLPLQKANPRANRGTFPGVTQGGGGQAGVEKTRVLALKNFLFAPHTF